MTKYLLLGIVLHLSLIGVCQVSAGIITGNFAGTTSLNLNPSLGFLSDHSWDVTIVGSHAFFETNYAYIPNSSLYDVVKSRDEIELSDVNTPIDRYPKPVIFRELGGKGQVDGKIHLTGPAFMMKLKDKYSLGFSTHMILQGASFNIPNELSAHWIQSLPEQQSIVLESFSGALAAWSSFNFHGGFKIDKHQSIGVTLKILNGYLGNFVALSEPFKFRLSDNLLTTESQLSLEGGITTLDDGVSRTGGGFSFDIGHFKSLNEKTSIGVSLLDIGLMRFDGLGYDAIAQVGSTFQREDYDNQTEIEPIFTQLNEDFNHTLGVGDKFTIVTPTGLSIQYFQDIYSNFKLNIILVQRLPISKKQIIKSNSLSFTAAYDRKHFSAFVPLTIYEYSKLRVGVAMRMFFLTVGSDHLFSLVGNRKNFDGSDIYIKMSIYPFKKGKNLNRKKVKCFF